MSEPRLTFLGAGNIASAIIRGLIASGFDPSLITATDPSREQLGRLAPLGIACTADNAEAVAQADVVLICVKPNVVADVARDIAGPLGGKGVLVISVAAGVPGSSLRGWLGDDTAVVRCMPNTPATVGAGMIALHATDRVTEAQRDLATSILGAIGRCVWLRSDDEIDMATALSGSGPAYFFYLMEAMEAAGTRLGLDADACRALVVGTAAGAATLIAQRDESPAALRKAVSSRGGTTQAALDRMDARGFAELIDEAVVAAYTRAREMARES